MIPTTLYEPLWMQNASYPAGTFRALVDAIYNSPGVVSPTDLAVTAPGTGMTVSVAAGKAVVAGTDTASQGKYLCWSDAATSVTIPASPPSGQSRVDLIVAQVLDAQADGGSSNLWRIVDVEGTATSGTPSVPATPASSIVLAHVAVAGTVTSISSGNLTDTRVVTGLTSIPGGVLQPKNGTTVVVTNSGSFGSVTYATPFPANYAPGPVIAVGDTNAGSVIAVLEASTVTNAGFTFVLYTSSTGAGAGSLTVRINWHAGVTTQ